MLRSLCISLCLLFLLPPHLSAQPERRSYYGSVHSPKGDLHLLVIFVRYEDRKLAKWEQTWPDVTEQGVLPVMARGEINELFNTTPESIGKPNQVKNISDYYYSMSGGQFRMTADIYPLQVPVKYIPLRGGNFFQRQAKMNSAAVKWIAENDPDFDWSRYDNRKNGPAFISDNSETLPDGILDYVIFMHRSPGSTGMGASSNIAIPNSPFRIRNGHTGINSYTDAKHNWLYFKHEFAHNLYNSPHYLGANAADGTRYYGNKGWGMMAAWHEPFFVANAWEAWWMGWLEVNTVTQSGQYELKDYLTGRDAIRIQLPGTEDYLWLENHQKRHRWDDKIFFRGPRKGYPISARGMYPYVVASPGSDRRRPDLNPFKKNDANIIRAYDGEGNFDYVLRGDSLKTEYVRSPIFYKAKPNPFAGQNDFQHLRADIDGDGKVRVGRVHGNTDGNAGEQYEAWTEFRDGEAQYSLNSTGEERDGLQVGDVIGLNGKFPALNFPEFRPKLQQLDPYILNGISIRVLSQEADGTMLLDIRMDDWDLDRPNRWCGELLVQGGDSLPPLRLKSGAKIAVELSGTPNRSERHPLTGLPINPTRLRLSGARQIVIESGATMVLDAFSILQLTEQSLLEIQKGGKLIVRDLGRIEVSEDARIRIAKGGKLIMKVGSSSSEGSADRISKQKGGKLKLRGERVME